jgi:hypothetical protein
MTVVSLCPSLTELLDDPSRVAGHIATCLRCRALAGEPRGAAAAEENPRTAPILGGARRTQTTLGDVCTVTFAARDEYLVAVVVDRAEKDTTVVAVSDDPSPTTTQDLRLNSEVLGYEAALDPAISGHVIVEQIHEVLGRVTPASLKIARQRWKGSTREDTQSASWPGELDRIERIEYYRGFWAPAEMIKRTPRLSDLIHHRARLAGVRKPTLAEALGGDDNLTELDAGTLDLKSRVAVPRLLATLRLLGIALHEGTARLIGQAAATGYAPSRHATGLPGLGPIRGRCEISATERRGQAQVYLDELWAHASASDLEET